MPTAAVHTAPIRPDCRPPKACLDRAGFRSVEHGPAGPADAGDAKRHTGVRTAPVAVADGDRVFRRTRVDRRPAIAGALGFAAGPMSRTEGATP